jgi:hypothetical protein
MSDEKLTCRSPVVQNKEERKGVRYFFPTSRCSRTQCLEDECQQNSLHANCCGHSEYYVPGANLLREIWLSSRIKESAGSYARDKWTKEFENHGFDPQMTRWGRMGRGLGRQEFVNEFGPKDRYSATMKLVPSNWCLGLIGVSGQSCSWHPFELFETRIIAACRTYVRVRTRMCTSTKQWATVRRTYSRHFRSSTKTAEDDGGLVPFMIIKMGDLLSVCRNSEEDRDSLTLNIDRNSAP